MKAVSQISNWAFRPLIRLPLDAQPISVRRLGGVYISSLVVFLIGTFLPVVLFIVLMQAMIWFNRGAAFTLLQSISDGKSSFTPTATVAFSVITFLTGFGAQLWYINNRLGRSALMLERLGLTLSRVPGKSTAAKLKRLAIEVAVSVGIWQVAGNVLESILKPPAQPTATLASSTEHLSLILMFILASVLAPIFEEIVFRGFLLQSLRSSFRNERSQNRPVQKQKQNAHAADMWAIVISSLFFSLLHFQFEIRICLMLFLMGCYMCEIYRRTGTLWAGIAFHSINNGLAVLMLAVGH